MPDFKIGAAGRSCVASAFALLPLAALAEDEAKAAPPQSLEQVVVVGSRSSDTDARRYSTAAKLVFGRDELDRYGDSTVGEVLKRLPGITLSGTPGRGGDIRLRGLGNGYTLILLNGEPAPRGFSLDSLSPDQIERIEVMRAPVAEYSGRAVAGAINIVLREKFVKKDNEARVALGFENGRLQPSLQLGKSDGGPDFDYNIHASPGRRVQKNHAETTQRTLDPATGATTLEQRLYDEGKPEADNINISSRLNWKLAGGDALAFNPFLMASRASTTGRIHLDQTVGAAPAPYADTNYRTDADSTLFRLMGNWRHNLGDNRKLDVRFSANFADSDTSATRRSFDSAGTQLHTTGSDNSVKDAGFSTAGKYSTPLGDGHAFASGWELEVGRRTESATNVQDGAAQLAEFGSDITAASRRLAAFGQDEWEVTPLLALYGGLRWEGIRTDSRWAGHSVDNDSSVLSPLLHGVWRFTEESRDQIRVGVTRSYKSPTLAQLTPRPTLAADYPTGANTATSPDSTGNSSLKPELAWGLDLALEHYLAEGGILSASVFYRSIQDLIRNVTAQQTVSWSTSPRWVTTPENVGKARTAGLELEAKFRLADLLADAPPLDLRVNFSRYLSRVSDVPEPDNRLDQQPTWTANLGADYRLHGLPLTLGGNINWTPAFSVRQSEFQYYDQGIKRVVDAYGLWKFDPNRQLRISLANLVHGDYLTGSRYADSSTDQTSETATRTYWALAARYEAKF